MNECKFECQRCSKLHDGKFGSSKFCSRSCANARNHSRETKQKIQKSLNERIGHPWNKGKRKPRPRVCQCGKDFDGNIRTGKYCSNECRKKYTPINRTKSMVEAYKRGKRVGGGTTHWYDYKGIKVQGTYELRACKILDEMKSRGEIRDWEYTNERFSYTWEDGTSHTYLMDFSMIQHDGSCVYLEMKGFTREHDERKWEAVESTGVKLLIWFKKDLEREEKRLAL